MIKTYLETRYSDPYAVPFYVEDTSGSQNTLRITQSTALAPTVTIQYSTDKQNWQNLGTTSSTGVTYGLPANGRVYLRASTTNWGGMSKYNKITASGNYAVGGNIMSLLYGNNFAQQTTLSTAYTFFSLFTGSSTLTNAGNLLMPATTLASNCYRDMFKGCSALTAAPALPATTLASNCYNNMFNGCTSLTTAPALPATTLTSGCYGTMFNGCSNLNSVTVGATSWDTSYTTNWLNNVSATGTIYINPALDGVIPENSASGVPSGWTKVVVS